MLTGSLCSRSSKTRLKVGIGGLLCKGHTGTENKCQVYHFQKIQLTAGKHLARSAGEENRIRDHVGFWSCNLSTQ